MPARAGALLLILLAAGWPGVALCRSSSPEPVAPGIFRSAQPDAAALRSARELGVKTVVVLRSGVPGPERRAADELGLELVHVPMDGMQMPTLAEVDRALRAILDPAQRPVLVHCAHGEERTGAVIAAYRVVVDGWEPAKAEQEALEHGFGFDGLADFLVRFREHWEQR